MRRVGLLAVAAFAMVVAMAGAASAVNEKDGGVLNAFDKLGPSVIASDSGLKSGLTKTGRFSKVQMVPLGWWDNGIRHITNSKRPVVKPADLKGLKIRTPPDPMTIDIFQALGAGTEQISFGELYVALQQGVVDGQENPLTNIASSKLYEVNKFISLSGHKWESSPFLMSQITWTRLPAADRDIIKAAAKEAGDLQRKLFAENEAKYNSEFRANPKLAVNEVDRPAFREASAKVVETWRAKPFGDFVDRLAKTARS